MTVERTSELPSSASGAGQAKTPLVCFIVEDSAVIRQNLIATMEEMLPVKVMGYAEDEAAALVILSASLPPPDLVIIDVFLKSGTGLNVLSQARKMLPLARLVVLTNYATPEIRRRSIQSGADRVFDKSDELDDLLSYCQGLAAGLGPFAEGVQPTG